MDHLRYLCLLNMYREMVNNYKSQINHSYTERGTGPFLKEKWSIIGINISQFKNYTLSRKEATSVESPFA